MAERPPSLHAVITALNTWLPSDFDLKGIFLVILTSNMSLMSPHFLHFLHLLDYKFGDWLGFDLNVPRSVKRMGVICNKELGVGRW